MVTHFACALGDERKQINMAGGTHNTQIAPPGSIRSYPCFRLDDFGLTNVDFIKIDVEGFEKRVLLGAKDLISATGPLIVIEQNHVMLPGASRFDARDLLETWGYKQVATCPRGWDIVMVRN